MKEFRLKMSDAAKEAVAKSQELRVVNIGVYNRLIDLENTRYNVCLHGPSYAHYSEPMTLAEVIDYLTWIKPERYNQCMVLALFPDCDDEQYYNTDLEDREFFVIEPGGDLRPCLATGIWREDIDNDVLITEGEVNMFLTKLRTLLDESKKAANGSCLTK